MKNAKAVGVALVVFCAVASVIAASAVALPTLLPTTIKTYTGKSVGKLKLERQGGLAALECNSAKSEGTVEANGHLGLFKMTLEKCTAAGGPCTGLGAATENIISEGSYHLVYDTLKGTLGEAGLAILFLLGAVHFVCSTIIGEVLNTVAAGGMVLCLIVNPTALTKVFEYQCKEGAADHPAETKYYNETGTLVSISGLESSENEGKAAEGALIGNATIEYTEAALLML